MKAIDFACRLLMHLEKSPLKPERQRILIALGAGLESCADIAEHTVMSCQQTSAQLLAMERAELVVKTDSRKPYIYQLSPKGRSSLWDIFSFLPKPQDDQA